MDGPLDDIPLDDAVGPVCPGCGYDLTGLPEGSNCPECDALLEPPPPPPPAGPLPAGSVCPRCGYDMEGLSADGACPECNAPASLAFEPNLFRNGPPALIRKQAKSAGWIFWAVIIVAGSFVLGYATMIAGMVLTGFSSAGAGGAIPLYQMVIMIGGAVILGAGTIAGYAFLYINWWRLTARHPGIADPPSRIWTRVGVVSMLAPTVLLPGAASLSLLFPGAFGNSIAAIGSIVGLVMIYALMLFGICAFFFGSLAYLRWLMSRVPDEKTRRYLGTCMWVIPLVAILGSCIVYLGTLAGIVLYLIGMRRVHKALTAEVRAAEAQAAMA